MEFRKQQSIFLQIGDYIYDNILMKKWQAGDRIPSIRELAVDVEVNPNTVMRAYAYLQERGVIYNQRGIGYFIADQAYENTRQLKLKDFIKHELSRLSKTLDLLGLKLEDLADLHQKHTEDSTGEETA